MIGRDTKIVEQNIIENQTYMVIVGNQLAHGTFKSLLGSSGSVTTHLSDGGLVSHNAGESSSKHILDVEFLGRLTSASDLLR